MSVLFFDRIRVDDPVGATSVHGVCGAWGAIAAALLHENLLLGAEYGLFSALGVQIVGVVAAFAWTFGTAFVLFQVIDKIVGLRVSEKEEVQGLDIGEHGASAYPDFVVSGS